MNRTIYVNEEQWKEVRRFAFDNNISISKLISIALSRLMLEVKI